MVWSVGSFCQPIIPKNPNPRRLPTHDHLFPEPGGMKKAAPRGGFIQQLRN
ncbi:hypothetical protein HMPREF0290_0418 [Corynebacterium efficiens YS-314]|nr:hypothetical protein HMPREF0290_0418 [Corynebacterium efficiens YS-314]